MRVGVFGGSFNPAHEGHRHVAEVALRRLKLDRVVWLVSPQNPLKTAAELAPLSARMADARRSARGPSMIVSDAETRMGTRFTVDTLRALKARFPGVKFVWLMGSDCLAGFHRWRGWTDIARLLPMAVVARPGSVTRSRTSPAARRLHDARVSSRAAPLLADLSPPAWVFLRGPLSAASSTEIRRRISALLPGETGKASS